VFCERARSAICNNFVTVAEDGKVTVLCVRPGCISHVAKSVELDLLLLSVKDVSNMYTVLMTISACGNAFRCLAMRSWKELSAALVPI
jgi:hypothetical protein